MFYPLLNVVSLLQDSQNAGNFQNELILMQRAIERHKTPQYAMFSPGDLHTLLNSRFDPMVLLMMLRKDQKRGVNKASVELNAI
jgi:hypothetical protein